VIRVNDQLLLTTFLELHRKLAEKGLEIILAGGFGLYVKQLDLLSHPTSRTLIPIDAWPKPRSTSDLDVFFPLEVLVSLSSMQAARVVIDEMNFQVIAGSEYWQFKVPDSEVKLDLLTGPIDKSLEKQLKSDSRRARPKGNLKLHAHPVPEAVDLSKQLEEILIGGHLPTGQQYSAKVKIPNPFTYLMMKVTTFGDQVNDTNKQLGRHHALDVYRIVAMLNEPQFENTKSQFAEHSSLSYANHVKETVASSFGCSDGLGILRIKEHPFFGPNMLVTEFIEHIRELTGTGSVS
jgi:hypothetical protein